MRPHPPPAWLGEVPPHDDGEGRLILVVCALVALVGLESRILDALAFHNLAAVAPVARAVTTALGFWGYL